VTAIDTNVIIDRVRAPRDVATRTTDARRSGARTLRRVRNLHSAGDTRIGASSPDRASQASDESSEVAAATRFHVFHTASVAFTETLGIHSLTEALGAESRFNLGG